MTNCLKWKTDGSTPPIGSELITRTERNPVRDRPQTLRAASFSSRGVPYAMNALFLRRVRVN